MRSDFAFSKLLVTVIVNVIVIVIVIVINLKACALINVTK